MATVDALQWGKHVDPHPSSFAGELASTLAAPRRLATRSWDSTDITTRRVPEALQLCEQRSGVQMD
jgi:hypothetical protein